MQLLEFEQQLKSACRNAASIAQAQAAAEAAALASEVSRLRLENDQLRRNPPAPGGPSAAEYDFLRIKLQARRLAAAVGYPCSAQNPSTLNEYFTWSAARGKFNECSASF